MSDLKLFEIIAGGLKTNRLRIEVAASNLANIRASEKNGKVYRRKIPIVRTEPVSFDEQLEKNLKKPEVSQIVEDQRPPLLVYDPSHPDAGPDGYVRYPNINMMEELVDFLTSSRAYELNLNAWTVSRDLILKTLEMGNK